MVDRVTIGGLPPVDGLTDETLLEVEKNAQGRRTTLADLRLALIPGGIPDLAPVVEAINNNNAAVAQLQDTYDGPILSAQAAAENAEAARLAAVAARGQAEQIVQGAEQVGIDAVDARNAAQAARDLAVEAQDDAETAANASAGSASTAAGQATIATTKANEAAGSASSATASANTATTKASEAATSASAASSSASTALTYRDQAGTHAASAQTSANTATTQAGNAATSASAASTSASSAASSATTASQQATAAQTSATTATTQAGNASTSASQAATSATNAAGSASAASSSATVASTSSTAAATTAALRGVRDFSQNGKFWSPPGDPFGPTGADLVNSANGSFFSDSSAGGATTWLATGSYVNSKYIWRPVAGRTYRLFIRARSGGVAGGQIRGYIVKLNSSNGNAGASVIVIPLQVISTAHQTVSGDYTATSGDATTYPNFGFQIEFVPAGGGSVALHSAWIEDVTSELAAAGSASAAATSASAASTSASGAATSASAAQTSATTATTQAGNASTSASQAATSATNAAGSASSASSSATLAASSSTTARDIASRTLPSTFEQNGTHFVAQSFHNNALTIAANTPEQYLPAAISYLSDGVEGRVLQSAASEVWIATRGSLKIVTGRRYRMTVRYRVVSGSQTTFYGVAVYGADGAYQGHYWYSSPADSASANYVTRESDAAASDILASFSTGVYIAGAIILNYPGSGSTSRLSRLALRDVTSEVAAADSATAAATSASNASTSAGSAGTSATSATNSANTATTQAGNASTSASAASSSAAAASSSAASASASATLSAQIGRGGINRNPVFADFPGSLTGSQAPPGWTNWLSADARFRDTLAAGQGDGSPYAFSETATVANGNSAQAGIYQDMTSAAPGWYVVEAAVETLSADMAGAGLYVVGYTAAYASAPRATAIGFHNTPTTSGAVVGNSPGSGKAYRFAKLVDLTDPTIKIIRLYLMTGWASFGVTNQGKTLRWYKGLIRPASDTEILAGTAIPTLQASVTTNTSAVADINTRMATAIWEAVTSAGGATAALRLKASTGGGGSTSSVSLEAATIQLWSVTQGARYKAMEVIGTAVTMYGDLNVGGAVRIGTRRIPVALQSFTIPAADGETISFGADLINTPRLEFNTLGLAAKTAAQSYDVKANSLTSTGFVMRAKILTPATPSGVTQGPGTNTGGTPMWRMHKASANDSANGYYSFQVQLNILFTGEPGFYEGQGEVDLYVRPNGGSWTYINTISQYFWSNTSGTVSKTLTGDGYYGGTIGQDAGGDYEFGVHPVSGTITAFTSVAYAGAGAGSGESSATPNGEKVIVTVIPNNG